jgi:hypothetical protein
VGHAGGWRQTRPRNCRCFQDERIKGAKALLRKKGLSGEEFVGELRFVLAILEVQASSDGIALRKEARETCLALRETAARVERFNKLLGSAALKSLGRLSNSWGSGQGPHSVEKLPTTMQKYAAAIAPIFSRPAGRPKRDPFLAVAIFSLLQTVKDRTGDYHDRAVAVLLTAILGHLRDCEKQPLPSVARLPNRDPLNFSENYLRNIRRSLSSRCSSCGAEVLR